MWKFFPVLTVVLGLISGVLLNISGDSGTGEVGTGGQRQKAKQAGKLHVSVPGCYIELHRLSGVLK